MTVLAGAFEAQRRALAARPANPTYRFMGVKLCETEAEIELSRGRHAEAARAARAMLEPALAPGQPLLAAGLLVRCAPLAEADGALGARKRLELSATYLAEVEELLGAAEKAGHELVGLSAEAQAALRAAPGLEELVERLAPGAAAER